MVILFIITEIREVVNLKRIERFLLILLSLISLLFSAAILFLFFPVEQITDTIKYYQSLFPEINIAIGVFCAFLCLCFFLILLIAIFYPKAADTLTFYKDKSKLQFSKRSVESAVRYSFSDISEINFSKVKVKLNNKPEKTRVFVKLSASDPSKLMAMTENIKANIESMMETSLGMKVRSVNIKITGINENSENKVHYEIHKDESSEVL